jgi:hypothetical protein
MKKSIFGPGLMFLGATLLVVSLLMSSPKAYSGSRLQDGGSSSPTPAASSNSPAPSVQSTGAILIDPSGAIVALLGDGAGLPAPDSSGNIAVDLKASTSPVPANLTLSSTLLGSDSAKLTQNGVYFPVYAPNSAGSSSVATVKVPASTLVGFCSGGYYDKGTGKCSNGQFPTKMVPLNSLSDPAAQTPTVVCQAPTVPTWNPAMKKWNCIVPTGFKNNL